MNKKILNEKELNNIQEVHDNGVLLKDLPKNTNTSRKVLERYFKDGLLIKRYYETKHNAESKKKISDARKKYLKQNPDKHPWKSNNKFKSEPCELLKAKLKIEDILFIEEYTDPEWNRFYSIDIAFPSKKIAIEINGNQHYNRDGTLKEYYKLKNSFLEDNNWKMFDIHYSVIYNKILFENLVDNIKKYSLSQNEFDLYLKKYLEYKIPKKYYCTTCGCEITKYSKSKLCNECSKKLSRKPNRPDYQTLLLDIKNSGYTGAGVKYSVSDCCIKKWLKVYQKTYNFEIPIIKARIGKSYCEKCGVEITKNKTNLCSTCYKQIAKEEMINKEDLLILMRTKTFSEIREITNKPRITIIRWCSYYGIPYKKSEYKL